jgi:hypothetical protein
VNAEGFQAEYASLEAFPLPRVADAISFRGCCAVVTATEDIIAASRTFAAGQVD